jgi:hypothetical protein
MAPDWDRGYLWGMILFSQIAMTVSGAIQLSLAYVMLTRQHDVGAAAASAAVGALMIAVAVWSAAGRRNAQGS